MKNRFYIEVRPNAEMQIGDMEWAKALLLLNMFLRDQGFAHLGAYLEENRQSKYDNVRAALVALVGSDNPKELGQMKEALTGSQAPKDDIISTCLAIDALMETHP
jgi:hypothetical protein